MPLVVAKVDRLTRSVAFLSRLLEAGVDVRFADLPMIEGATGKFLLQQAMVQLIPWFTQSLAFAVQEMSIVKFLAFCAMSAVLSSVFDSAIW